MASARRFISSPQGPEGSAFSISNPGQPPYAAELHAVEASDIIYPPPGGGLLRVPVGGGAAAEMLGTLPGQINYWSQSAGLWLPTSTAPSGGQTPVWDATAGEWVFAAPPSLGAIEYFDNAIPAAGLWNFNGVLTDISGNGNDLALSAGNLAFCDISPGKLGLYVLATARYQTAGFAAALQLLGDVTVLAIVQRDQAQTTAILCSKAASGELEAANQIYSFTLEAQATDADLIRTRYQAEQGAGADITYLSGGNVSLSPIHNIMFCAMRRTGNVIRFYVNGLPFGPDSGVLAAPTGGADPASRFVVGANSPGSANASKYVLFSLKVVSSSLSDDDIKSEYNRTLGLAFGVLP